MSFEPLYDRVGEIFYHVPLNEQGVLPQVCKGWKTLSEDNLLWIFLGAREKLLGFGLAFRKSQQSDSFLEGAKSGTYKQLFKDRIIQRKENLDQLEKIIHYLCMKEYLPSGDKLSHPSKASEILNQIKGVSQLFVTFKHNYHKLFTGEALIQENVNFLVQNFTLRLVSLSGDGARLTAFDSDEIASIDECGLALVEAIVYELKEALKNAEDFYLKEKADILPLPAEIPSDPRTDVAETSTAHSDLQDELPDELLLHIFTFLASLKSAEDKTSPLKDLFSCSLVSRQWNRVSKDTQLWNPLAEQGRQIKQSTRETQQRAKRLKPLQRKLATLEDLGYRPIHAPNLGVNVLTRSMDYLLAPVRSGQLITRGFRRVLLNKLHPFQSFEAKPLAQELYGLCDALVRQHDVPNLEDDQVRIIAEALLFWMIVPYEDIPLLKEIVALCPSLNPFPPSGANLRLLKEMLFLLQPLLNQDNVIHWMQTVLLPLGSEILKNDAGELMPPFIHCLDELSNQCHFLQDKFKLDSLREEMRQKAYKTKDMLQFFPVDQEHLRTQAMIDTAIQQESQRDLVGNPYDLLPPRLQNPVGYAAFTVGTFGGSLWVLGIRQGLNTRVAQSIRKTVINFQTAKYHITPDQVLNKAIKEATQANDTDLLRDLLKIKDQLGMHVNPFAETAVAKPINETNVGTSEEEAPNLVAKSMNVDNFLQAVREGSGRRMKKIINADPLIKNSAQLLSDALLLAMMHSEQEPYKEIVSYLIQRGVTEVLPSSYDAVYKDAFRTYDFDKYARLVHAIPYMEPSVPADEDTRALFEAMLQQRD